MPTIARRMRGPKPDLIPSLRVGGMLLAGLALATPAGSGPVPTDPTRTITITGGPESLSAHLFPMDPAPGGQSASVAHSLPSAAVALPKEDPPVVPACRKIVSKPCTSCDVTMSDDECKSGNVYRDCDTPHHICGNGARCDQHVGTGSCGP
jgi:hypothetical protein